MNFAYQWAICTADESSVQRMNRLTRRASDKKAEAPAKSARHLLASAGVNDSSSALQAKPRSFLTGHLPVLVALFVGLLLPLVLFGKIAENVHEGDSFWFDDVILSNIHRHASPRRDAWIIAVTRLGGARCMVPFLALVCGFLLWKQRKSDALFFLSAAGGAMVLCLVAKLFFGRERPALWLSPAPETDYGFPSGHSMATMGVVASLIILAWPTRWRWIVVVLGAVFVLTIGITRLYLGVHYPTDVLGGWSAALIWVSAVKSALWGRDFWQQKRFHSRV